MSVVYAFILYVAVFFIGNDLFGEDEPDEDEDTPLTKGSGLFSGGGGGGLFDDDVVEEQVRIKTSFPLGTHNSTFCLPLTFIVTHSSVVMSTHMQR